MENLKNKLADTVLIIIVVIALIIRLINLEGRTTFDWDQERDVGEVMSSVENHSLPLLGPVVRGEEGGFYLGPFYYYLIAAPLYFTNFNPISLSMLSVIVDMLVVVAIYLFVRSLYSPSIALVSASIWAFSWLNITSSHTPWNVSFISPWMLAMTVLFNKLQTLPKLNWRVLIVFTAALSTSIHFSLIPIAILILFLALPKFRNLSPKEWFCITLAGLIPLLPLISNDIIYDLQNTRLFVRFFRATTDSSSSIIAVIQEVYEKTGYTVARFLIGKPTTTFGLVVTSLTILHGLLQRKNKTVFMSVLVIIFLIIMLLVYGDLDFAEYYLIPLFIPIVIIFSHWLNYKTLQSRHLYTLVLSLIAFTFFVNAQNYRFDTGPYSLSIKKQLVSDVASLEYPIELDFKLPRDRNSGFSYYIDRYSIFSDPKATKKVHIYESTNLEIIAPEEARSIIYEKSIGGLKIIVFSD